MSDALRWEDWERMPAWVKCPWCGSRINAEILPKAMADVTCPSCGITKLAVSFGTWTAMTAPAPRSPGGE